jgi:hypothetical protein
MNHYFTRREALYSAFGLLFHKGPLLAAAPSAKAKSVIQIWMWGGPAHLDTFDPKPDAGNDYCGPLKTPIATNVPEYKSANCCRSLPNRRTSIPSSAA